MGSGGVYDREFEELFKENYSRLFYYALDYVEDEEAAKDIVSEVFSDIWENYAQLRGISIRSYMARAVKNRSINYLRHQTVDQNYRASVIRTKTEAFEDSLDAQEEKLQLIEKVMESFTPQTRTVFENCYLNGKKYKELADELNISVSAVNKHMTKALAAFRAAFAKKTEKRSRNVLFFFVNLLL